MAYINIDHYSKITPFDQTDGYPNACASVCACMCVNTSPSEVESRLAALDKPVNFVPAPWAKIGQVTSYTNKPGGTGLGALITILKQGHPVVARIAPNSDPHWVVIYGFEGNDIAPTAVDFSCLDPWGAVDCRLLNAMKYQGVYVTQYYVLKP